MLINEFSESCTIYNNNTKYGHSSYLRCLANGLFSELTLKNLLLNYERQIFLRIIS